jgi:hypothetical protein
MRPLRVLSVAILVFVFGAAVSAPAQAVELPEFTVATHAAGTGGTSTLDLESTQVGCSSSSSTFGAGKKEGTFEITFKECKNGGKGCISLGESSGSGLIAVSGTWHLVTTAAGLVGMWFLMAASDSTGALHLECESATGLVLLWGNFLGLIGEFTAKTFAVFIERETTLKQVEEVFENNSGETIKVTGLKGKLGTGTEKVGTLESVENLLATEKETKLDGPWLSRTNVGGAPTRNEPFCKFAAVKETCQITFKNITMRTLKISQATGAKILGVQPTKRYKKKTEGCVFNAGMGECTDEIEVLELVALPNSYCLEVTDQANLTEHGQVCAELKG